MDAPIDWSDIISRVLICVGAYLGVAMAFGVLLGVVMLKWDDIKRTLRPRRRHLKLVPYERDPNGQEKE